MEEKELVQILFGERLKVLMLIVAIVRDEHVAEDLFQEVVVKAVEIRPTFKSAEHLRAWLYKAAKHRAIDQLRKAENRDVAFDEKFSEQVMAHLDKLSSESAEQSVRWLRICLGRLSPSAAHLIGLRYTEGVSGKTIAERLGRSVDSVYAALCRIRRALSKCIREQARHEEGLS